MREILSVQERVLRRRIDLFEFAAPLRMLPSYLFVMSNCLRIDRVNGKMKLIVRGNNCIKQFKETYES